jgi:hypothetical protein
MTERESILTEIAATLARQLQTEVVRYFDDTRVSGVTFRLEGGGGRIEAGRTGGGAAWLSFSNAYLDAYQPEELEGLLSSDTLRTCLDADGRVLVVTGGIRTYAVDDIGNVTSRGRVQVI